MKELRLQGTDSHETKIPPSKHMSIKRQRRQLDQN